MREEVITGYRADLARLLTAVSSLSEQERNQAVAGDWSAKDILAHIAAWDRELVRGVEHLLAGQRPEFVSYVEDEFNARIVEAARYRSFVDVLADTQQAHAALIEALKQLTDEQWSSGSVYSWADHTAMTIASLFSYRYRGETHYAGHAAEIESRSQANIT